LGTAGQAAGNNIQKNKEEAYEKTVYNWGIIVLGNCFDRSTDGVCLGHL
jgi:hypothetical protein